MDYNCSIITKLRTLKLFKDFEPYNINQNYDVNQDYIQQLIYLLQRDKKTNELLEKGDASKLFTHEISDIVCDLFLDAQRDNGYWETEEELAEFAMVEYNEDDDEYNIAYKFIDKIRNSFIK